MEVITNLKKTHKKKAQKETRSANRTYQVENKEYTDYDNQSMLEHHNLL